jgi:hypothetical protein
MAQGQFRQSYAGNFDGGKGQQFPPAALVQCVRADKHNTPHWRSAGNAADAQQLCCNALKGCAVAEE